MVSEQLLMIRTSYCFSSLTNAQYSVETLQLLRNCGSLRNETLRKTWTVFITLPPPPAPLHWCQMKGPRVPCLGSLFSGILQEELPPASHRTMKSQLEFCLLPENSPAVLSGQVWEGSELPVSTWFASPQKCSHLLSFPPLPASDTGKTHRCLG